MFFCPFLLRLCPDAEVWGSLDKNQSFSHLKTRHVVSFPDQLWYTVDNCSRRSPLSRIRLKRHDVVFPTSPRTEESSHLTERQTNGESKNKRPDFQAQLGCTDNKPKSTLDEV